MPAEQRQKLASANLKRKIIERRVLAVALGDVSQLNDRFHCGQAAYGQL